MQERRGSLSSGWRLRYIQVLFWFVFPSVSCWENNTDFGNWALTIHSNRAFGMYVLVSSLNNPGGGFCYRDPILQMMKWRHLVGETAGVWSQDCLLPGSNNKSSWDWFICLPSARYCVECFMWVNLFNASCHHVNYIPLWFPLMNEGTEAQRG